jgi:hypothetical protein
MSGSGGSSGGAGGSGDSGGDDCASILEITSLASPVPDVLKTLKQGDLLDLKPKTKTGPLQAFTSKGKIAGSVTSGSAVRMINCIEKGFAFVAIVNLIDGGKCEVTIRSKSQR